ncbi:hypothetical protein OROGR_007522 [Orobanche gracilis]
MASRDAMIRCWIIRGLVADWIRKSLGNSFNEEQHHLSLNDFKDIFANLFGMDTFVFQVPVRGLLRNRGFDGDGLEETRIPDDTGYDICWGIVD